MICSTGNAACVHDSGDGLTQVQFIDYTILNYNTLFIPGMLMLDSIFHGPFMLKSTWGMPVHVGRFCGVCLRHKLLPECLIQGNSV